MYQNLLRTVSISLALAALTAILAACSGITPADTRGAPSAAAPTPSETVATPQPDDEERPAGWSEESHSNDVDPNYDVVFPTDAINTLTITIAPDDWAAMQADMEDIYAPSLYIRKAILAAGPNLSQEEREKLLLQLFASRPTEQAVEAPPLTATEPVTSTMDAPAVKQQLVTNRSPMWVPATITFQGREWTHVGVRYKGASSLSPWIMGDMHLPFKLDFDQFEDDYPEIDNQRFFGFKELSLANNYQDPTGMRDTLVYELLAEAGLPSLRTAPYEIMLDYGEGPVRLGLYTMIEVVDDTGVPSYFGSDNGNIYEGEGYGVSLAEQDSHLLEDSFEKKNNEKKEDWSDIWTLYDALNSEKRTSDPEAWRADLEKVFDVDGFLEWLGIAAVVGHSDTYGLAYHNFYLYNNPETGRLTWFSWDHNLTFRKDIQHLVTFDKSNVTDAWPLIRYLLDDPVYWERYVELMRQNFATVLAPEAMIAKIRAHAELIKPVATQDMNPEEYDAAAQELIDFVQARAEEVDRFLQEPGLKATTAPVVNDNGESNRPPGWTQETHSNKVDPNYDVVFPSDAVNALTITIAPDDWAAMQADMEEIFGEERDQAKALAAMTEEERLAYLQKKLAEAGSQTEAELTPRSPMWVPATIAFQGREWTHVGVRYKGASSLKPWMDGNMHLPFKLDFDQFEDDYPEIDNQRFFGFKQLSLANNYQDPTGMRDTLVYELLAEAGLPSLRTAPYEIMLDYGEGPVRLGLYTMIEVIDDTGVTSYFGSDDGNIYEGDGPGASLSNQVRELVEDGFEKKNNEDKEDWSDIWALYDALNSEKRASDPAAWRASLEAVFDVDGFLEWLGIASFVGHGDTYGVGPHNFYLYNNPETGRLTWFSWDHNLTFRKDIQHLVTFDKSNVTDAWPLIRYLLDDPVYWERYVELMRQNFATVLAPEAMIAKIRAHAELIKPIATQDMSPQEYDAAVQVLIDFVQARSAEAEDFLAGQK